MGRTLVIGDIHGGLKALEQVLVRASVTTEDKIIFLGDYVDGWADSFELIEFLIELDKSHNCIFIKGNHDCLDDKTELFTQRGWISNSEVNDGDLVLGLNPNGLAEWQRINSVIRKKSDHINYFKNERINMAITDKHRILHKDLSGYNYTTLEGYNPKNDRYNIPMGAASNINLDYPISDDEIRLIAWILTDGSINSMGIQIFQSKLKNVSKIENLLKRLNFKYSKSGRNRNIKEICGRILKKPPLRSYKFSISIDDTRKFINKYPIEKDIILPWVYKLSFRQARIFINECIIGDGTPYKNSYCHIMYGTHNFLSFLQGLCSMNGFATNLTQDNRDTWRLNINQKLECEFRGDVRRVEGEFDVWCLSVPLTNFLVRREGKSYFTGNCWADQWLTSGMIPIFGSRETWKDRGGQSTLDSYNDRRPTDLEPHRRFFRRLHHYYEDLDNNRVFVHAGYTQGGGVRFENPPRNLWWDRNLWEKAFTHEHKFSKDGEYNSLYYQYYPIILKTYEEIFIGHTSCQIYGTIQPIKACNVTNMDTGCGHRHGVLTIMDVDSREYWQSDRLTELYPEDNHNTFMGNQGAELV